MTDLLDWFSRGFGLLFCLLLAWVGITMILPARVRQISPWMAWGMLISGSIWLGLILFDWAFPIIASLYVTNGSDSNYEVSLGTTLFCLPANSYKHMTWRLTTPGIVDAGLANQQVRAHYPIGKGTWFVNVSPVPISADLVDYSTSMANWNGVGVSKQGSLNLTVGGGTPYRLFSESSADKLQAVSELMKEKSSSGHCSESQNQ